MQEKITHQRDGWNCFVGSKADFYIKEFDDLTIGKYVVPITCEIDPSNGCQLNCNFCLYADYLDSNSENLEFDTFVKVCKELKEQGTKSITFTGGGEPLMNPNINKMIDFAFGLGFEIGLITNGVLLHKVKNKEKFSFIRISLDAATLETYIAVKGKDFFDKVISNITDAIIERAYIGLSFVVCEENVHEINSVIKLAEFMEVQYLQIKPSWTKGFSFTNYEVPKHPKVIHTKRWRTYDWMPCQIAGIIGILGADGNLYYCCQKRGNIEYKLGSVKNNSFEEIWKRRLEIIPEIKNCSRCRYMNYAKHYRDRKIFDDSVTFKHRHFL